MADQQTHALNLGQPAPAGAGSLMDRLRAQQADAAAGKTVDLRVPGYRDPDLFARYRFLHSSEAKKIGQRIRERFRDDVDRLLNGTIDTMIAACEGLYARDGNGELVPVDADGGGPVRYDPRATEFFNLEVDEDDPARSTVRAIFKGNDYAILDHGGLLQQWMSDTTAEVNESLGER